MSDKYTLTEIAANINEPTSRRWNAVVRDDKIAIVCGGQEVLLTKTQATAVMGLVYNAARTEAKKWHRDIEKIKMGL
jgi:hypothetical protein